MRAHARPRPRLRRRSQRGADGIEREIAQRVEEVGVVHRERGEPPLEQMAGCAGARVHERGEAPMRLPHRPRKSVRVRGGQDEMNVVGHEAAGPAGDAAGATALGEQVAIEGIIARLGEQRLSTIAPLASRDGASRDR